MSPACRGRHQRVVRAAAATPPAELNFAAIESPSLQFLPRGEEAAGWRLQRDPIVIPADHLGIYLQTEAPQLISFGLIDMTAGTYAATAGPGFADVEIFRFPDFVKAFGAYSDAKKGPLQYANVVNEAFVAKHSVHVWRGPFYVHVIGGGGADEQQAMLRLATAVADRMPPAPGKPAVFNFLPVTNRIPNTERYSATSGFGQKFLGNSFQATFDVGGGSIEGLVIPAPNKAAAANILARYRQLYVNNGKLMDPVANLGEDNFTAEDPYLGRAVAFRIDRFVVAFNGYAERQKMIDAAIAADQRILGTIRKELVTADNADTTPARTPAPNAPPWAQRP